jgi:hypothetical protein
MMQYHHLKDADLLRGIAENSEAIAQAAKDRLNLIEGRVTADDATRESLLAATARIIDRLRREIEAMHDEFSRRHPK